MTDANQREFDIGEAVTWRRGTLIMGRAVSREWGQDKTGVQRGCWTTGLGSFDDEAASPDQNENVFVR